jgi:peptidoglycan/xylan/chitin deacetylase (PgdA/CDA1 family)
MAVDPIALTFDDGPDPRGTPAVLDALAHAGATATFFVIAPQAEREPELVRRIGDEGHVLAVHCDIHVRHTELGYDGVVDDLERALARLDRLAMRPSLWRTPWGVTEPWTQTIADEHGLSLVGWDVDSHDWRGDRAADMFAATRPGLRPGAIVLAHDGIGPGARRADSSETAAYVELVADHARGAGVRLGGLS